MEIFEPKSGPYSVLHEYNGAIRTISVGMGFRTASGVCGIILQINEQEVIKWIEMWTEQNIITHLHTNIIQGMEKQWVFQTNIYGSTLVDFKDITDLCLILPSALLQPTCVDGMGNMYIAGHLERGECYVTPKIEGRKRTVRDLGPCFSFSGVNLVPAEELLKCLAKGVVLRPCVPLDGYIRILRASIEDFFLKSAYVVSEKIKSNPVAECNSLHLSRLPADVLAALLYYKTKEYEVKYEANVLTLYYPRGFGCLIDLLGRDCSTTMCGGSTLTVGAPAFKISLLPVLSATITLSFASLVSPGGTITLWSNEGPSAWRELVSVPRSSICSVCLRTKGRGLSNACICVPAPDVEQADESSEESDHGSKDSSSSVPGGAGRKISARADTAASSPASTLQYTPSP